MCVNRKVSLMALCMTMAVVLTGCHLKTVYNHYESTRLDSWGVNDTLVFRVSPLKHSGTYESSIGLRTTSDYPYIGLTLIVEQEIVSATADKKEGWLQKNRVVADTINATLVTKDGEQLGKGVGMYQYLYPLRHYELNEGDSITVRIHHFMRTIRLPGVADVGFRLTLKDGKK